MQPLVLLAHFFDEAVTIKVSTAELFLIRGWTLKLLETKFGSQVYGTATPFSDIDIGVVALESPLHVFGLQDATDFPQIQDAENRDVRRFWLKRFLRLCVRGNPNVLEWLYTPDEHIEFMHPLFNQFVLNYRSQFLDYDKIIQSHLGFAKSQIIKMTRHEKEMGAKRRALVEVYGYDTKYASHAIRLIYQLTDVLSRGRIVLPYPENVRTELLAIKLGQVSLSEFDVIYQARKDEVEQLIVDKRDLIDSVKPDHDTIACILEEFYQTAWC